MEGLAPPGTDMPSLVQVSAATQNAGNLEDLSRPILDWLQRMTRLESTYLTRIHWEEDEQEVLYALNRGRMQIPEQLRVRWSDTLCRRALSGGPSVTDNVPRAYPDSEPARQLGLQTYVSVPIELPGGHIYGTLCGASSHRRRPGEQVLEVMRFFAQLIADRLSRDRELEQERLRTRELQACNERIAALEKIKSDFLRLAGHELRQPVTVVSGFLDLTLQGAFGDVNPKLREILELLSGRLDAMNHLLDEMMDTARIEDDRLDLDLAIDDLREVVGRATAAIRALLTERHQLSVDIPDEPVPVRIDSNRIDIIVGNLLSNALKYSPDGGEIRCRLTVTGGTAQIVVEDEGVGIAPDQVHLIFRRFGRIDDPSHARIPGLGLGLHISRELARRHGGDVWCEPDRQRGSAFVLTLPLASPPAVAAITATGSTAASV